MTFAALVAVIVVIALAVYGGRRLLNEQPLIPEAWRPRTRAPGDGTVGPPRPLPQRVSDPAAIQPQATGAHRHWPGRTANATPPHAGTTPSSPRPRAFSTVRHPPRPAAAGERVLSGSRFTPPDAICPACSRRFEECTRPTCLGRGPIR